MLADQGAWPTLFATTEASLLAAGWQAPAADRAAVVRLLGLARAEARRDLEALDSWYLSWPEWARFEEACALEGWARHGIRPAAPGQTGQTALAGQARSGEGDGAMNGTRSPQDIRDLDELRCPELALSLYLPAESGVGCHYFEAQLKDLARSELHKLDAHERDAFRREERAVLTGLAKQRFESPAIAVFACTPRQLLEVWRLAEPAGSRMAVADWLDLAPIHRQLAEHPPALAAVVDKQRARLFGLTLGELTELEGRQGLPIAHHEQGGWSATVYQRRQEEHARWNLDRVAAAISALMKAGGYKRLLIAGPPEARALLKELLEPAAVAALAGEGSIPIFAEGNDMADRLRKLLADHAEVVR